MNFGVVRVCSIRDRYRVRACGRATSLFVIICGSFVTSGRLYRDTVPLALTSLGGERERKVEGEEAIHV